MSRNTRLGGPYTSELWQDSLADALYDRESYSADGSTNIDFYSRALCMGTKTYEDTNMYLPNQLPQGVNFLATSIEIVFLPSVELSKKERIADINAVARSGCMSLVIQNREYARVAPLSRCPAVPYWMCDVVRGGEERTNFREDIRAQLSEQFRETDYGAFGGGPFLMVPIWIESQQYFCVKVENRAPLPSGVSGTLYAFMQGRRIRPYS